MSRTKIVATIGPSSDNPETIRLMLQAGLNVARVNFSHGKPDQHISTIQMIRRVAREERKVIAILGDLQGPKIRLGLFEDVELLAGDEVRLSSDPEMPGTIPLPHPEIVEAIKSGARLVLGDGEMELVVLDKEKDLLICRARYDGVLQQRKGVNTPGTKIPIASITEKDRIDLDLICQMDLDFVALSFVREADDIVELRELMARHGKSIPIIAKIEKFEAIDNLEAIAAVSDGMMVARGDLGLDMPTEQLPMLQKRIMASGNKLGKPVITATQMLQSMVNSPRPTRAEASDVANAILDGTDAIMLSNETASGKYPVEAVQMMSRIANYTEAEFPYELWEAKRKSIEALDSIADAISSAACNIAERVGATIILTSTISGYTARQIARHRPRTPIMAVSPLEETQRHLALVWGVECTLMEEVNTTDEMIVRSLDAIREPVVNKGDLIVLTGGVPFGKPGLTNLIQVHPVD